MDNDEMIGEITRLHQEHFNQFFPDVGEVYYSVRITKTEEGNFLCDVVATNDEGLGFVDGGYYHNCDGCGSGKTLNAALKKLLAQVRRTIREKSWEN